jgi:hypothetical protein
VRSYDFHEISPVDFEVLTRDLLQARDKVIFQSFKSGRDRGVDLRYASDRENRIVQCKHMRKSGYRALLREVRAEAEKIKRIHPAPSRYYFSTSVELSNENKNELAKILGLKHTRDILGSEDINNLLGLFPHVETSHFKLWLASTEVLQRVIHSAEVTQSKFEFQRIRRDIPRFVQTYGYELAKEQLDEDRIIILSGMPGVGKTTMAEFLLYEKFADGFEPVIARNGVHEAGKLYKEGVRQVFYYDDFLGATFLGETGSILARNEDRAISDFIARVEDDDTKLLILTTREHILAEALERSERLKASTMASYHYVVEVGDYDADERARILYNHAYFNALPSTYLNHLLKADFYIEVIEHPKFSPRLVEWITSPRRLKACLPDDYPKFALQLLDDPAEIWDHAYKRQISHAARSLLLALHGVGQWNSHANVTNAFDALHRLRAERYHFSTSPEDLVAAMRVLGGSFISIRRHQIEFLDPSVRDLMNAVLVEAPDNCIDIAAAAVEITQIETVWRLAEAEPSGEIRKRLVARFDEWVEGLVRALQAVHTSHWEDRTWTYAYRVDERLGLLVDMATTLEIDALRPLIAPTVDHVIASWAHDRPRMPVLIRALQTLRDTPFLATPAIVASRLRLRSALMRQKVYDLTPAEVMDLLNIEPEQPLSSTEASALQAAAGEWPRRMGDWLRDCRSEPELEALRKKLVILRDRLEVDLRGPIGAVETELIMYVEPEEREDRARAERLWERRMNHHQYSTLFDTLRRDDNTG